MKHTLIIRDGIVYELVPMPYDIIINPCSECDLYDECVCDEVHRFTSLCYNDNEDLLEWYFQKTTVRGNPPIGDFIKRSI